jgi:hypothetical protein
LELMNLTYNSGSISFEPVNWYLIISNDCVSQANGHSCWLFVILITASMFYGFQLTQMNDPIRARYRIYDIIQKYYREESNRFRSRNLPQINQMHLESINIIDDSTTEYIRFLINSFKVKAGNNFIIIVHSYNTTIIDHFFLYFWLNIDWIKIN